MTDGIELLKHDVKCPVCGGDNIEINNFNVDGMEDEEAAKFATAIYECLDDEHKFNICVKFDGTIIEVSLDECIDE